MLVEGVAPEGGYQTNLQQWAGHIQRLTNRREPPRCMYPSEFIAICRRFLRPRWQTIGLSRTRFGDNPRLEAGFGSHGTIYVADPHERRWLFALPANCIPYGTMRNKTWDEWGGGWSKEGEFARGWRSALEQLVKMGYLVPHSDLSYLIGVDTYAIFPIQFRR